MLLGYIALIQLKQQKVNIAVLVFAKLGGDLSCDNISATISARLETNFSLCQFTH